MLYSDETHLTHQYSKANVEMMQANRSCYFNIQTPGTTVTEVNVDLSGLYGISVKILKFKFGRLITSQFQNGPTFSLFLHHKAKMVKNVAVSFFSFRI